MKKTILLLLIWTAICQPIWAQVTIEQLMQTQMALTEFNGDEDFNIPQVGRSEDIKYKSRTIAALYSLILPGAGQYYIGDGVKTKLFLGIEAGTWISYFGFRKYGSFKKEAAKGWAVLKAGACPNNNDDRYWVKMTYYDNRDRNEGYGEFGYNQMASVVERENAILFPETPEYYWNWDNKADRQKYRNLRNQSKTAYDRADITIGILIANHVISAVQAYWGAGKYNRRQEFSLSGFKMYYSFNPDFENPSVIIGLTKHFN
ncbi:MAG: hypothetical protein B6D58_02880 [candidate division Zixibacteria bacterium 4484_95]|nr:MAG: hypothetical protein B6D58_02880 [candidate division Zixibacteria bacterium 4484_95]